ncbi:zinc finger protein 284-like [Littorina saxatilis]|uniref:zinc finger protein 284-like n=1 Tax=Littorina saxatilis TaxID=31220 RepID=UPI0038B4610E
MEATRQSRTSSFRQQRTRTCIVCEKKSVTVGRKIKTAGNFSQDAECCCVTCKQILTCTVSAFVQGFAISWAVCSFSKHVANGTDSVKVKLEPVEGGSSVVNCHSLNVPNGTVKIGQKIGQDSDDMPPPVHFVSEPVEGKELNVEPFNDLPSAMEDSQNESSREEVGPVASGTGSQGNDTSCPPSSDSVTESNSLRLDKPHSPISSTSQLKRRRVFICNSQLNRQKKAKVKLKAEKEKGLLGLSEVSNRTRSKKVSSKSSSGVANRSKRIAPKYHSCAYCSETFTIKRKLQVHVRRSHSAESGSLGEANPRKVACEFCANFYTSKESLRAHIKRCHSDEPEAECDVCGSIQPGTYALSAHKKSCHEYKKLCYLCGAVFSNSTAFDKHMAGHYGVKRFFCDICKKGFLHKSSLYTHRTVHVSIKSVQCDICPKTYKVQHLLNSHLLHAHQCGPSLKHRVRGLKKMGVDVDKDAIIRHAKNQCVICGQGLLEGKCASHPENSQQVFECPTCGEVKDHIVLFYQHIKWHKGTLESNRRCRNAAIGLPLTSADGSGFKCVECSKTFKTSHQLRIHMHQHREARFSCEICSKKFTYKCNLKQHMNWHLNDSWVECEVCKKKFKDKVAHQLHKRKHMEPQFKCDICGKGLTRRQYLEKHIQTMHPDHQQSS